MAKFSQDTDRLVLRSFEADDLEAVLDYYTIADAQRYLDYHAHDRRDVALALEQMQAQHRLTRPGDSFCCAVARQADGQLVGQASLRWTDATAGQGELRFVIAPQFRNHGYGTEAAQAMIGIGFDDFGFHRIFARCSGRDRASAHLLRKLGLRLEAHYREHALYGGEWDEELHFAVLDREWGRDRRVTPLPVLRTEPRLSA
jgi:RimJ/RimL family protein N-acetyltransferase